MAVPRNRLMCGTVGEYYLLVINHGTCQLDRYVKVGTIYTKLSRYDDDGGIAADRPQDIPVLAPFALPEDLVQKLLGSIHITRS